MTNLASPQPAKRHLVRTILLVIGIPLVVTMILAVVAGGLFASNLSHTFDSAKKIDASVVFPLESVRPAVTSSASQNILLMGSDTRGSISENIDEVIGMRADTMMVVHLAADRRSVHVISIMRDSWVEIPGHGMAKMSSALSLGGVPLVVQMVESLLGARIDRVAVVDYEGFAGITDALGGVRVENPVAFEAKQGGFAFATGPLELNGKEALGFVGEPKEHANGEFQRVKNQQLFLKSVLAKTLRAETLTNPVTVNKLVASITPFLTVDSGFTSAYAAGLAFELREIRMENVTFFTMPTLGTGTEGKESVVHLDWDEISVLQEHFREDTLRDFTPPN